jgi:hypothetical protein
MSCKWLFDEICCNDKCPACADFCPVNTYDDYIEICRYAEEKEE